MSKQLLINMFGWGFGLWLFGYVLGIILFAVVPPEMLGWVITPFGVAATLWVLFKKVKLSLLSQYALMSVGWLVIAVVCDYVFLVQLLKPADGYYKLDVYLYYLLTLVLPMAVGWWKTKAKSE